LQAVVFSPDGDAVRKSAMRLLAGTLIAERAAGAH
jgi:hypothetical protein